MSEEKLNKQIVQITQLAAGDKKIDVASLMINALQTHESNLLPVKQKRWAYLISLSVPPVGLFFALKFWLAGKDDSQEAAIMCLVLTAVSILLAVLFAKALLSGSGTNLKQIENINPNDLRSLYQ